MRLSLKHPDFITFEPLNEAAANAKALQER